MNADELRCPRNWERFKNSCYKFTRSPIKRWDEATLICQAYRHQDSDHSDLASISTLVSRVKLLIIASNGLGEVGYDPFIIYMYFSEGVLGTATP